MQKGGLNSPDGSSGRCREQAGICSLLVILLKAQEEPQHRFLSDINPLWLLSSCPFAHTELPLSNCHGSLLLFFCLNWQNYVISEISLRQCSCWQQKRQGLLLTFILQSKVRQRKFEFLSSFKIKGAMTPTAKMKNEQ